MERYTVEADLFITERPYLFGERKIHIPCVTLCRVPEALAMAGLYLRSQGEYVLWRAADGSGGPTAEQDRLDQVRAIAAGEGISWNSVKGGSGYKDIVQAAGGGTGPAADVIYLSWKLCCWQHPDLT